MEPLFDILFESFPNNWIYHNDFFEDHAPEWILSASVEDRYVLFSFFEGSFSGDVFDNGNCENMLFHYESKDFGNTIKATKCFFEEEW